MMQIKAFWRFILSAVFLLLANILVQNSFAQTAPKIQQQLQEIEDSIEVNSNSVVKLEAEIRKLDGDRTKQTAALIAAASRLKLAEIEASAIEENLLVFLEKEKIISKRLDGANFEISNMLGALQRIGRSPAPALIVNTGDALSSARSAILISAVLPQLRKKAKIVSNDLSELSIVVAAAQKEEDLFIERLIVLGEEKLRVSALIAQRQSEIDAARNQILNRATSTNELIEKAKTLEELLKALSNQEKPKQIEQNQNITVSSLDPTKISAAFANNGRTQPAILFSSAKGYLEIPAAGVIVSKFNDDDNLGGKAKGISIITRAEANVVAPIDGWVIYQGDYLNYGKIIIIDPGEGYSIILAGLKKVNVKLGDFVLRNEPVGIMGLRTIGGGITTKAGISRPTLYIELRKQDKAINPSAWWRTQNRQPQSG